MSVLRKRLFKNAIFCVKKSAEKNADVFDTNINSKKLLDYSISNTVAEGCSGTKKSRTDFWYAIDKRAFFLFAPPFYFSG